ncbi:MAG: 30S ribosomal protein S13 [Desulfurococcales archaeon]|nr:30S ribosomal protein S13 [Desulfurococcales archaeon]
MPEETYKHIVRIAGIDIEGDQLLPFGLAKIKGIGYHTGLALVRRLGLDPHMRVGYLSEEDVEKLEDAVNNPQKYGLPSWYLNRRKDFRTGEDRHLIGADLIYEARQDIERLMRIRSWRGIRHQLGLKVRGQRTHTTGRLGPVVGVSKKKR